MLFSLWLTHVRLFVCVFLQQHRTYLANLCLAKSVDGVKVTNYFAWSIFDNFEWASGWTNRFGECLVPMSCCGWRCP